MRVYLKNIYIRIYIYLFHFFFSRGGGKHSCVWEGGWCLIEHTRDLIPFVIINTSDWFFFFSSRLTRFADPQSQILFIYFFEILGRKRKIFELDNRLSNAVTFRGFVICGRSRRNADICAPFTSEYREDYLQDLGIPRLFRLCVYHSRHFISRQLSLYTHSHIPVVPKGYTSTANHSSRSFSFFKRRAITSSWGKPTH